MSETKYLKLFKHDTPPTNKNKFDVQKALNDNWDKSDEFAGKAGAKLNLDINVTDYVMTLQLLNINDEVVDEKTIDFPLESVVVSGRYDKENKKVILTLQNGTEVEFSIEDLIDGLVSQSTFDTEIQKINVEITNIKDRLDTIEKDQTTQNTKIKELREENKRLREDLGNSTITASNSGENIIIKDGTGARFKKLLIKGNTYQKTSKQGKNMLDLTKATKLEQSNGITYEIKNSNEIIISFSGKTDTRPYYLRLFKALAPKDYYIQCKMEILEGAEATRTPYLQIANKNFVGTSTSITYNNQILNWKK